MSMIYNYLGHSGLKVSALSFGSWVTFHNQLGVELAKDCLAAAYEEGCTFFDNAEVYAGGRSEEVMGEAIQQLGWARDSYVISTKIYWAGEGPNQRGLSRKHIVEGTLASLRRLQHDYVDLIFCHRPDLHTPLEETVRAMNHVLDRGWALYWGTSEWSADQIRAAYHVARDLRLVPPLVEQPEYHMFHRDRIEQEYAALYRDIGLGTTTWSPLASGLLTGKYNDGVPDGSRLSLERFQWLKDLLLGVPDIEERLARVRRLAALAGDLGVTTAQLAIAWCARNPNVSTVITGASRVEQVRENMAAIDLVPRLTPEVLAEIEAILGNRPSAERDWREG